MRLFRAPLDPCLDSPLLCQPLTSRFAPHGLPRLSEFIAEIIRISAGNGKIPENVPESAHGGALQNRCALGSARKGADGGSMKENSRNSTSVSTLQSTPILESTPVDSLGRIFGDFFLFWLVPSQADCYVRVHSVNWPPSVFSNSSQSLEFMTCLLCPIEARKGLNTCSVLNSVTLPLSCSSNFTT